MKPHSMPSAVPRHITPEQDRHIRRRTRIFCLTMAVVCFGTLLWRLFVLQVMDPDGYAARAADQQLRDTVIPAPRGEIYSADGTLLAASETRWTIRASPRDLADDLVQPAAQALSEILEIDYEETLAAFSNRTSNDCLLKRRVDKATADAVRSWCAEHGAEGIQIRQDTKHIYPEGDFMGVLLGFTDVDNAGLWGLELEYDELLTGTNGRVLTAKDAWGYDMPQNYSTLVEPVPGATLTLTIDANIQRYLESALSAAVEEHNVTSRGVGIVMDVETGAILAMTVKPDYDPNDPRTIVNEEIRNAVNALEGEQRSEALQTAQQAQWRNKAISDLYEPGSVFKLITAAAALDTGACTPDSQFVCAGSINVAGTRFRCANGHIHGLETFAQGLAVSCNPCFIQIGARLGKEAFCDYFAAFGLREATGIDLPGEIKQSEYYTADRMGPVHHFGPCLFYIITIYFALKKQRMQGPVRQIPCFALNGSHAAGQKLLRNTDVTDGQHAGAVLALPQQKAGFGTAEGDGFIRLHGDAQHGACVAFDPGGNVAGNDPHTLLMGGVNGLNGPEKHPANRPVQPDPEEGIHNTAGFSGQGRASVCFHHTAGLLQLGLLGPCVGSHLFRIAHKPDFCRNVLFQQLPGTGKTVASVVAGSAEDQHWAAAPGLGQLPLHSCGHMGGRGIHQLQ